ncbi:MAG: PA2169 family four-helix-bundle protein [Nitrosospira sp.]|nr:PA2169 family four-helix-bundle protein [Nitrosospira sp.]
MDNDQIVSTLNGLIEISRDGAQGFRTCAQDATDEGLKLYFENRAQSCEQAVRELSAEVRRYGGDPDTSGTVTGTLHRAWVDIRTAMTNRDNMTVLEECERGEAAAVMAYENALRQELPGDVRALLDLQYEGAKRNHDRVRQLRDAAKNKPNLN